VDFAPPPKNENTSKMSLKSFAGDPKIFESKIFMIWVHLEAGKYLTVCRAAFSLPIFLVVSVIFALFRWMGGGEV